MLCNLSEIYDTTRIASVRIADMQANMSRTDSARYGIKTLFKRPPIECPLSSNLIVRSGSITARRDRSLASTLCNQHRTVVGQFQPLVFVLKTFERLPREKIGLSDCSLGKAEAGGYRKARPPIRAVSLIR
ncbi:hypothetical protein PCAR4_50004 [Paraburkholderia caribensis]|nr:hypothetical protein PCAR4_50004 [Paraburkholderia caribensis]